MVYVRESENYKRVSSQINGPIQSCIHNYIIRILLKINEMYSETSV